MATKSKEELLAEAKELNLEVTEENTVAEIKQAIADAKPAETPEEESDAPDSAQVDEEVRDNGAGAGREPQIVDAPETTFDERTGAGTPPWQREDGSQDNGEEV